MALVSPAPSCQGQGKPEPEVRCPLPAYTLVTVDGKVFVFVITVVRLIGKSINITSQFFVSTRVDSPRFFFPLVCNYRFFFHSCGFIESQRRRNNQSFIIMGGSGGSGGKGGSGGSGGKSDPVRNTDNNLRRERESPEEKAARLRKNNEKRRAALTVQSATHRLNRLIYGVEEDSDWEMVEMMGDLGPFFDAVKVASVVAAKQGKVFTVQIQFVKPGLMQITDECTGSQWRKKLRVIAEECGLRQVCQICLTNFNSVSVTEISTQSLLPATEGCDPLASNRG